MSTPQQYPGSPRYPESQPYAYDPYSASSAGPGKPAPVRRPGLMGLFLVLALLASAPFLLIGTLLLVAPLSPDDLPSEVTDSPRLQQAGATPELLISAFRLVGVVLLAVALIYLLFAVFAFAGRNWARVVTTVLSVGFALLLIAALVASGGAADTVAILGLVVVVLLGALAVLFSPRVNAWYARRR